MEKLDRLKINRINLKGFKSFSNDDHIVNFQDITILIGANGAGKSSLISFFKMLNAIITDSLDVFVGQEGFASSLLHYGPKITNYIYAILDFSSGLSDYKYKFVLNHASGDKLIFSHESFSDYSKTGEWEIDHTYPSGNPKSNLKPKMGQVKTYFAEHEISFFLEGCQVYQFQDTSSTAKIRNGGYINDNQFLRQDGGNLAAYLFGLKENTNTKTYYDKIIRHIRTVFPQFGDFVLNPSGRNETSIILDWVEKSRPDYILGPHQLSDGTLRFIAMATLLLQPPEKMPRLIIIDEPELGLHPSAIIELAGMVKSASQYSQIFLATQSPALLDEFEPEQVVVIERDPVTQSSILKEFTSEQLQYWLKEYTLSEMWDKNILGGKP